MGNWRARLVGREAEEAVEGMGKAESSGKQGGESPPCCTSMKRCVERAAAGAGLLGCVGKANTRQGAIGTDSQFSVAGEQDSGVFNHPLTSSENIP